MASFTFTSPEGKSYTVEGPDGATKEQAWGVLQQRLGLAAPEVPGPTELAGPPASEIAPPSWGDTLSEAVSNVPESAVKFGQNLAEGLLDPIKTATTIYHLGRGVMGLAANWAAHQTGLSPDKTESAMTAGSVPIAAGLVGLTKMIGAPTEGLPQATNLATDKAMAKRVGKFYADRYGGVENAKRTIANDPVGALADLSAVLSMGGAALESLPGAAGRVGEAIGVAGRAVDPVTLSLRTAKGATLLIGKGIATAGTRTGAAALQEGFEASRAGGNAARAFRNALRGKGSMEDAVAEARTAVSSMYRNMHDRYLKSMTRVRTDATELDMSRVDQAVQSARSKVVSARTGRVIDENANKVISEISDKVDAYRSGPPEFRTPGALDELKREINALAWTDTGQPRLPKGSLSRSVYDEVRKSIGDTISAQAPEYAKTMRDYSQASDQLSEIERSLSLGEKATVDTAARKLLSIFRNNANTNYGQRVRLGKELMGRSETLGPALAGQIMNAPFARGVNEVGRALVLGAGPAAVFNPPLAAAMVGAAGLQSPRLLGEVANAAGAAYRYTPPESLVRNLARVGYQVGRAPIAP